MAGLYYEQFETGNVFKHAITRTVTETDNTLFSVMTMNTQPLHIDADFAAKTEFGQRLVCLLYTSPSPRDRTRSRMPSSA